MNIPEEFGHYLLLKKLREDALGETFRAGRAGRDGIEQVVLLRVFNGPGMDGERLWQKISGRGAVQQALRSPNIGSGVDLGKVRSYPFVAYDYISGKNLAALLAQAARQHQPIPADHALLISERLALALAAANESRVQDERVLHGFVVPQLVMISNEGETRLLGFEAAPGLRELYGRGWHDPEVAPYIAPEAATGGAVAKTDDVYSLGAILFELLTGERLPPPTADGYAATIDAAVLASEGTPLPPAVAQLLKKSLVARDQRIGDAVTWHKAISKLMIEGQFSSTTFNLAFFMHNLFRDEIERESQELEAERQLELPRRAAAAAGERAAGPAGGAALPAAGLAAAGAAAAESRSAGAHDLREGTTGVREPTWPGSKAQAAAAPARKPLPLIAGAAAALLLAAGGAWFVFGRSGSGGAKPAAAPPPPAAAAQPAAHIPSAAEAAAQQAQIEAQIKQMIEARSKDMEVKLKGQYDDQIKQLQKKLDDSKRAAETQDRSARAERSAPAAERRETQAPAVPLSATGASEPARPAAGASAAGQPASSAQAPPAAATAAGSPQAGGAARKEAATAATATTPAIVPPPAAATPPIAPPQPEPASQPRVQIGDLVQMGAGVVPPKSTHVPQARYPPAARRFNKSAEVIVRVLVDERGRVVQAEHVGTEVGFGFDESAIEAAREATFQPATKDAVRVKMWTTIKMAFKP
jgi:TonB family protein